MIAERIRYLTEEKLVFPSNILVLTFSKAAAGEMKERYVKAYGRSTERLTFGTFHSVFLSILLKAGRYRFTAVAEKQDRIRAVQKAALRKYKKPVFSADMSAVVCDEISRVKNGMGTTLPEAAALLKEYDEVLSEQNMIDYDDMLLTAFRLLCDDRDLLNEVRNTYRYILVDEFQDINRVQYDLIRLISAPKYNVFCVGDDDQSIYGFRGSEPAYMKRFPHDFKNCRIIRLEINYRSSEEIVRISSRLITHNKNRYEKHLKSFSGKGGIPVVAKLRDPSAEASYIQERAKPVLAEKKTVAVLVRTNRALEEIRDLMDEGIRKHISFHTFHSAKGLEFDAVFVAGMNEELIPGQNAGSSAALEEERRTFYVALTRARKCLYILYTANYRDRAVLPSRFLSELT